MLVIAGGSCFSCTLPALLILASSALSSAPTSMASWPNGLPRPFRDQGAGEGVSLPFTTLRARMRSTPSCVVFPVFNMTRLFRAVMDTTGSFVPAPDRAAFIVPQHQRIGALHDFPNGSRVCWSKMATTTTPARTFIGRSLPLDRRSKVGFHST
jgi:hypothetical protein